MKKFVLLLACTMLCFGTLAGCKEGQDAHEKQEDTLQQGFVDPYDTPTVYEMYANESGMSLSILKIDRVDEAVYQKAHGGEDDDTPFLAVECTVEEDYFHRMESGKKIHLPISLYTFDPSEPYYDVERARTLLETCDRLLVYSLQCSGATPGYKNLETGETFEWEKIYMAFPADFDLIPIRDDKVDLQSLFDLTGKSAEEYKDFTKYISDGLPMETLKENLKNLAKEVK